MKTILTVAALLTGSSFGQAHAATLSATSLTSDSDFSVDFNDLNGDSLLQFNEIVSFSGVTVASVFRGYLTAVPNIAEISRYAGGAGGQKCDFVCGNHWFFGSTPNNWSVSVATNSWTYEITGLEPVPVPASLPLLVLGIGGLGYIARRKRTVS